MPLLIDTKQAADILGISPKILKRLAAAGRVPAIDIGTGSKKYFKFYPDHIKEWVTNYEYQKAAPRISQEKGQKGDLPLHDIHPRKKNKGGQPMGETKGLLGRVG